MAKRNKSQPNPWLGSKPHCQPLYVGIQRLIDTMTNGSTCFFPDGTVAPRDTPCHDPLLSGGASACCAGSDVCLDNNLCLAQSGPEIITRGSCTDWKWLSSECPQYCPDGNQFLDSLGKLPG